MYKALKIELKLTVAQKIQVNKTIGVERFIYNEYIKYNQEQYKLGNKFVSANDFSKYINNIYLPNNPDKKWIKDVSSKSVKQAIIYGEQAFKRFFKGLSSFPIFKKKGKNELGAYFVKNNKKDFEFYRHKIKIPTLKFVRVKEYGYIPKNTNIKSGTITKIADRYFLSLIIEVKDVVKTYELQFKIARRTLTDVLGAYNELSSIEQENVTAHNDFRDAALDYLVAQSQMAVWAGIKK